MALLFSSAHCFDAFFRPLGVASKREGRQYAYHEGVNMTCCTLFNRTGVGSVDEASTPLAGHERLHAVDDNHIHTCRRDDCKASEVSA